MTTPITSAVSLSDVTMQLSTVCDCLDSQNAIDLVECQR